MQRVQALLCGLAYNLYRVAGMQRREGLLLMGSASKKLKDHACGPGVNPVHLRTADAPTQKSNAQLSCVVPQAL